MSQPRSLSQLWIYLSECARILYWAYFKPFTFKRWLSDIHPELKPTDNPFSKQQEFAQNPLLRRYAYQAWWLSLTVPLLTVLLIAPIYSMATGEPFNWLASSSVLLGWTIGLLLVRENSQQQSQWFYGALIIIIIGIVLFFFQVISRFTPEAEDLRQSLFSSQLFSALWIVIMPIAWYVAHIPQVESSQ